MIPMFNFENYTLVVYETSKDYHGEVPDHRFVAYLKEIPEASLHEYGPTQGKAIAGLREQFEAFVKEATEKGVSIPPPECRDEEEFSGRIVLRMPPWLHRTIDRLADEEGSSTNSYIVNRLNRTVTIEEAMSALATRQEKLFTELKYRFAATRWSVEYLHKSSQRITVLTKKEVRTEYKPLRKVI
jgi:predicted HicB family RNase H-like nuclease